MKRGQCLILEPLLGHPKAVKKQTDLNLRETVNKLAHLDGGFVVSSNDYVLSATHYFNATSFDLDLLLGLGTHHIARHPALRRPEHWQTLSQKGPLSVCLAKGSFVPKSSPSYGS